MNYLRKRRTRKIANELLRNAKHLHNMREDMMQEAEKKKLSGAENEVRNTLKAGGVEVLERASNDLYTCLSKLIPRRSFPAFRENFEIIVVAITVAMAFRTYFIQPFKIPTGSMQPTLYGIHSEFQTRPSLMDRMPLKLAKWVVCGEWYKELRVKIPGQLSGPYSAGAHNPSACYYYIGGDRYKVPKDAKINFNHGDYVYTGAILWSGVVTTGDHVFVDKIRWNFGRPKRGQVMVFTTDNIAGIPQKTHYIKRLVGLPRESVGIEPPNLLINGQVMLKPESIARIARQEPGYEAGYTLAYNSASQFQISLAEHEYFVLGDNTKNSKDGRYWGAVPEQNAVGPAFLLYWPFSGRWGLIK